MAIKIFFCYAHEDEALLDKFKTHLRPLQRQGLIDVWHDRDISAGTEWEQEIEKHLNTAQIILLLVSPDFIDSDYCYGIEMKRAIERHEHGEARVIPVIFRPTLWHETALGKLQALPKDARPVTDWPNLDDALHSIAEDIFNIVTKFRKAQEEQARLAEEAERTRRVEEERLRRVGEERVRIAEEERIRKVREEEQVNAGQKPPSQLASQTSIFHLIRETASTDAIWAYQITLDDKKIGKIENGESCTFEVEPGPHTIFLHAGLASSPHLAFDFAPGQKLTFLCKGKGGVLRNSILLWKQ
jgi:hypothetical protein